MDASPPAGAHVSTRAFVLMFWLAISGFFLWLAVREIARRYVAAPGFDRPDPSPVDKGYLVVVLALAAAFAYQPVRYWMFERMLTRKAQQLAESPLAHVHCNTVLDTFLDNNVFAAGHATPQTGRIVFQHPWCGHLMDHLRHPDRLTREGIVALHIFTHEAMHIRGELDEARTECQAIQRHLRAARLLGVSEDLGVQSGRHYFENEYRDRAAIGGLAGSYYSEQCGPGKPWDERLPDSIWG